MPETRASIIDAPVLLNPVVAPPREDLLAGFQANEEKRLGEIRNLGSPPAKGKGKGKGNATVVINLVSSSPEKEVGGEIEVDRGGKEVAEPEPEVVVEEGRPKRASAKRAAAGFPEKTAPAKRPRKTI